MEPNEERELLAVDIRPWVPLLDLSDPVRSESLNGANDEEIRLPPATDGPFRMKSIKSEVCPPAMGIAERACSCEPGPIDLVVSRLLGATGVSEALRPVGGLVTFFWLDGPLAESPGPVDLINSAIPKVDSAMGLASLGWYCDCLRLGGGPELATTTVLRFDAFAGINFTSGRGAVFVSLVDSLEETGLFCRGGSSPGGEVSFKNSANSEVVERHVRELRFSGS